MIALHRTHASAIAAVLLPGAFALAWPLGAGLALGIIFLRSLTGIVGALAAAVVLYPVALWSVLPVLLGAVLMRIYFPPGAILKTSRARLVTWLYLLRTWSWRGVPWYGVRVACEAAWVRSRGASITGGPPHNEWLHVAYRFGAAGVLVLVVAAAMVWPLIAGRTLLGATIAALVAVCAVSSPVQAFRRWLRKGREGPLFGPPLRWMCSFYVDHDGEMHVLCTRALTPTEQAQVVLNVFNFGKALAQQYGVTISMKEPTP